VTASKSIVSFATRGTSETVTWTRSQGSTTNTRTAQASSSSNADTVSWSGSTGSGFTFSSTGNGQDTATATFTYDSVSASCTAYFIDIGPVGPTSCFIAGTPICLQDNTFKKIKDVAVGDKVKGENGSINTVLRNIPCDFPFEYLYGLNGENPFFTANHPFLTTEGWKALDPDLTAEIDGQEIADLLVGKLEKGDVLIKDTGEEEIILFTRRKFEENEKLVYNLSTDGTNTYIANNYVVHNKCDIRLKKNIRFLKWFMGQNIYTWEWNELAAELGIMGPTKGFIAQEVLKTRPDAVVLDDDGYYSVDFRKLGLIK
jgi:hypothetical protein